MKKQKGFIIPLLIIIIVALAISGGVYIHSHNKKIAEQTQLNTKTSPSSTTVSNINHNNSEWKTQIAFNIFTFQYPSDWRVEFKDDDYIIIPPNPKDQNDNIVFRMRQANCDSSYPRCIWVSNSTWQYGPADLHTYSNDKTTLDIYSKILTSIKVNGVQASTRNPSPSPENQTSPRILSISIQPSVKEGNWINFKRGAQVIVTGKNLTKVEVRVIPTGSGSADFCPGGCLLGSMIKNSTSGETQTWTYTLGIEPAYNEFWAVGYGNDGSKVESQNLDNVAGDFQG